VQRGIKKSGEVDNGMPLAHLWMLESLVQDIHWSIVGILHGDVASSQIGTGQLWTNLRPGAFGSGEVAQFLSAPAVSETKGGAHCSDRSLETKIKEEVESQ